jgi:hypothetical protein
MCIYYKGKSGLAYISGDHIIMASIGGKLKLPTDFVSHEFNNSISNLEGQLVRTSLLSLARSIEGPGKRGSLIDRNATKSRIFVVKNYQDKDMFALGYVIKGKTYEIPHVKINCEDMSIEFSFGKINPSEVDSILNEFKTKCNDPGLLKIKKILDSELPKHILLFGIMSDIEKPYNAFFVKNEANSNDVTNELIQSVSASINTMDQIPEHRKYTPIVKGNLTFSIEHFRVFGKMAFNYLAYISGKEFVLADRFDKVRDWIVNGGEHIAYFDNYPNPLEKMVSFPDSYHMILIFKVDNILMGKVLTYKSVIIDMVLCENFSEHFTTKGFICDWLTGGEYDLDQFIINKLTL